MDILKNIEQTGEKNVSLYKTGPFIDLCRGPHVSNTKVFKVLQIGEGNRSIAAVHDAEEQQTLTRIYGIAFPSKELSRDHAERIKLLEEADHRLIGAKQKLWMFHDYSPGSPFFLEHGTRIINRLKDFLRKAYYEQGYKEVVTPQLYDKALWETSGHWEHYREDMFLVEGEEYALKPMNCPGHCLIYASELHSFRELPVRLADFSPLHRNEARGTLGGLTRVRKFVQDDAHIFCREDQIYDEMDTLLSFIQDLYTKKFNFQHVMFKLSTRPKKFSGSIDQWDHAESILHNVLEDQMKKNGRTLVELNAGDGAFYGPKIDVHVKDAFSRTHQLATVQLDFQLPTNFKLEYMDSEGVSHRPVIIHRAVLGSFERFIALLSEQYRGKFPFWLSPRQVMVIPLSTEHQGEYASHVQQVLKKAIPSLHIDVNLSKKRYKKKIRDAQLDQYAYILVVGPSEMEQGDSISVRTRSGEELGSMNIVDFEKRIQDEFDNFM